MVLELNTENFEKEVLNKNDVVLVDMFASWCGPCKMLAPVFEEVSEVEKNIKFGKLDIEKEASLAERYNVSSVPTLILFVKGQTEKISTGLVSRDKILNMIAQYRT